MAEQYPQYYIYERRPVVFVEAPDGGLRIWALSSKTGEFRLDKSYLEKIWFGTTADVDAVSRPEFVQRVEEYRGRRVHGGGPVYALYETINSLEDTSRAEARDLSPEERVLIHTLRLRTHELFEKRLRAEGRQGLPEGA
ncbi:hypothetical protein [Actinomadura sediminis]|uniref:DUF4238 domain-containing protein n=1 Tax=Actinomadura sediminis TaxID=1038904 RepID=A0ABW3ERY2_9ACTN